MKLSKRRKKVLSKNALSSLVAGHDKFLNFLERRVESRAVAEDILQSAYLKGLESSKKVEEHRAVAWFYRVLRNAVIDYYRRREVSKKVTQELEYQFVEELENNQKIFTEICECISVVLKNLKPEYQEAIRLIDLKGNKLSVLSDKEKITPSNAAVRLHRARQALKKEIMLCCGTCAEHGCAECECK